MERHINDKEKEKIKNMGAFGYSFDRCAVILGWSVEEVEGFFNDPESDFNRLYNEGKIKFDYVIDIKLFEQAMAGDINSLEKLEERKTEIK